MKKNFAPILLALILCQCTEKEPANTTESTDKNLPTLVEENLEPYVLTAKDTVYSIALKLSSQDSVDVQYSVTMMLGSEIYADSLVFNIPANDQVDGQIIFSGSRVSKLAKPTFTSKLKILNGK